ncbi:MAG: hypothetical protein NVS9B12_06790 [Vulcanimicrobiaceae bacterium]
MMQLPEFSRAWDYENNFYLSCQPARMGKLFAHYELFQMSLDVPGDLVECGVFKGASLVRFAMMRELFATAEGKKIVGFDAFGAFPETAFEADKPFRDAFIEGSGESGIAVDQLQEVLAHKGTGRNVELIAGDVRETVPEYVKKNPQMRISLLNIDTDVYEPAVTILRELYPLIVPGGILVLDDYGVFPGETAAVDEYFAGQDVELKKFPFHQTPCYIIKRA